MTTSLRLPRLLAVLLAFAFTSSSALAIKTLDDYFRDSVAAMKAGKWLEAHKTLQEVTDNLDEQAPITIGPRFGWFWYHRGYAALKVKDYDDALLSFQKTYERYPNQGENAEGNLAPGVNPYHKMALLKWGDTLRALEQWQEALDKYEKFLVERDKTRDKFPAGPFYINLAIAYFNLGKLDDGMKHLETAIVNKYKFPTPERGIMSGFHAFVQAVIQEKKEAALLDFIRKNRANLHLDPAEAYDFAPLFMSVAQQAREAGMQAATYELYSLVPDTYSAVADAEARLAALGRHNIVFRDGVNMVEAGPVKETLKAAKERVAKGNPFEVFALMNGAQLQEESGNVRGAFSIYRYLEETFPDAVAEQNGELVPVRENNLYNLVRTASVTGQYLLTEKYGTRFLDLFPDSERREAVQRMMLTSLFWNGEYVKALEVANSIKELIPADEKSGRDDIVRFVQAGSHFYLGNFQEAEPLIDEYLSRYPEADTEEHRHRAALYFQASTASRMENWDKAVALLDAFLKKYPDPAINPYLPFVLFDRANSQYALENMNAAMDDVDRLKDEFPDSPIAELALNLKGNIYQSENQPEEALEYYRKALALAKSRTNHYVAGESLFYLVALLVEENKGKGKSDGLTEAAEYYDEFWDQHRSDSPYLARIAVAGMEPLKVQDRSEEALERLQTVVSRLANLSGTPGLEETINSYTEAYLEGHSAAELKEHYYNFPGIRSDDDATRALLRIATIGAVEDQLKLAKGAGKEDEASKHAALIKVLFTDLRTDFDPKILSNYILVRVGDYVRENTGSPAQARPYYEEAISREDASYRFPALFGLADLLAAGSEEDKTKAVGYLEQVYNEGEDRQQRERALFRMIKVLEDQGNFNAVVKRSLEYLDKDAGFRSHVPEVQLAISQAYERTGATNKAIPIYSQIWGGPTMGYVRVSAPAIVKWGELVWKRNRDDPKTGQNDRQYVYDSLARYLELLEPNLPRMTPQDQEKFQEVKKQLEAYSKSPDVVLPTAEP